VGGNHELRLVIDQAVNQGKDAQLPLWGERSLWLIQQVNSVTLKSMLEQ
jgi:hypothetical protein